MPQLLDPSFLRLGRRSAAILLALGALGLLVTGLTRPADASDPYVAGGDATSVTRLTDSRASVAGDRAVGHERVLGLPATVSRTVDRIVDRRGHRTFDEVAGLDDRGRLVEVLRYSVEGRLIAASRLGWGAATGPALADATAATQAADRLARAVGIAPDGRASADARGSNGWNVRWARVVNGIPVPGDGLRVQLWADGSLHGLAVSEHALAAPPATPIDGSAATHTVEALLDRWIPAKNRSEARIAGSSLAWVAPNDTFEAARPDAPLEVRRLGWVVTVTSAGTLAGSIRGLEVWIDAADGSLLGGDVVR